MRACTLSRYTYLGTVSMLYIIDAEERTRPWRQTRIIRDISGSKENIMTSCRRSSGTGDPAKQNSKERNMNTDKDLDMRDFLHEQGGYFRGLHHFVQRTE